MLTTVSFGQIRFSTTLAYGLERWGGVYRRVAGIDPRVDVIPMPRMGYQDQEYDETEEVASDPDEDDTEEVDEAEMEKY